MITPLETEAAQRFVDICRAAQFTESNLSETLGTVVPPPPHHAQSQVFRQQTEQPSPFNALTRLFFLAAPVRFEDARGVLPTSFLDSCLDCGLLTSHDSQLCPAALVVPCGELLVAADVHQPGAQDYVLPLNHPALHLLQFTIRRPVRATLDLCCGSALHGLTATAFSDHVVASDLNPRAKMFGQFNAALNGLQNMEYLTGQLYEPVAGRKFDLILCNPPFVISPATEATFRETPLELDGFLQQILQETPEYLQEGGFLQVIGEWVEIRGHDGSERLRQWIAESGCDAWVLQANRQLPENYIQSRLSEMALTTEELTRRHAQWLANFQNRNVDAFYGGLIFLRRREGVNWFHVDQLTSAVQHPVGDAILQGFSSRNVLHAQDSERTLLAARPRVAPGLTLKEKSHWEDDAWHSDSLVLGTEHGLPVSIGIDDNTHALITRFDGRSSVAAVLKEFADQLELPVDQLREQCLQTVRLLIQNGCLLP